MSLKSYVTVCEMAKGMNDDISPNFKYNPVDAEIGIELIRHEATPMAIIRFSELCHQLTDYGYWFFLSTLWVSYSGCSNLQLWRKLFKSGRPKRSTSIMKPSEWEAFKQLPDSFTGYRAHRRNETDWISYTLDRELEERWSKDRDGYVQAYALKKKDCLALFLRRGEQEILMLDRKKVRKISVTWLHDHEWSWNEK